MFFLFMKIMDGEDFFFAGNAFGYLSFMCLFEISTSLSIGCRPIWAESLFLLINIGTSLSSGPR